MPKLTEIDEKRIKNTIRRMAKVLMFAFPNKSDIYIGFYALLTAQNLIKRFFEEDCDNASEFKHLRACLINQISEMQKELYEIKFKGGIHGGH